MIIVHASAECYPVAKAGGLADVVGALPKYQCRQGDEAKVIMPMHRTEFLYKNEWETIHQGSFSLGERYLNFTIIREKTNKLGFELYCVDIYGLLDREKIYGYDDDDERFIAFQIAVLEWINAWEYLPDVLHVHDHHAALIPFMIRNCFVYDKLNKIPTLLTIHNGNYQGIMSWDKGFYLPAFNTKKWGLLDWNDHINRLACGIKCADKVNTVSQGYMNEIMKDGAGLESLYQSEKEKCIGILNGIDTEAFDPATDTLINDNYSIKDFEEGKLLNKQMLCKQINFDSKVPLFVFIGRMVKDKGADILPEAIARLFKKRPTEFSVFILGSGMKDIETGFLEMNDEWPRYYTSRIDFNEPLSHKLYASADFLLMPSRVEPCGLNQMYALRYGTIPIVRRTGGLKDTVVDMGDDGGYGICFDYASVVDIMHSMERAIDLYNDKEKFQAQREHCMAIDNSWDKSSDNYKKIYLSITKNLNNTHAS